MSDSAKHLLDRIRDKDTDALATYIDLNRPQLLAFIDRKLGVALKRKVEPEDLLQEVSTDAVRGLPDVKLLDDEPFSWLCQIAQRRIVDAHRRFFGAQKRDAAKEVPLGGPAAGTQQGGLINMLVNSMTTPSQAFSRNAREEKLLAALHELPEMQREALRMRYVENLPSKEIAKKLGKTDGALRVMLTRSLKKLEEIMLPELGGDS